MQISYIVKHQRGWNEPREIGEYATFLDASSFIDECIELGQYGDDCVVTIDRREIDADSPEIVIDRNLYRRRFY